jgi:hypothetical protein
MASRTVTEHASLSERRPGSRVNIPKKRGGRVSCRVQPGDHSAVLQGYAAELVRDRTHFGPQTPGVEPYGLKGGSLGNLFAPKHTGSDARESDALYEK